MNSYQFNSLKVYHPQSGKKKYENTWNKRHYPINNPKQNQLNLKETTLPIINNNKNNFIENKDLKEDNEELSLIQIIWDDLGVSEEYQNQFLKFMKNLSEENKREYFEMEKNYLKKFRDSLFKLSKEISSREKNIEDLKKFDEIIKTSFPDKEKKLNEQILLDIQNCIKLLRINSVNIVNYMYKIREISTYSFQKGKYNLEKLNPAYLYNPNYLIEMGNDMDFLKKSSLNNYIDMTNGEYDAFLSNCHPKNEKKKNNKIYVPIGNDLMKTIKNAKYIIMEDILLNNIQKKNDQSKIIILKKRKFRGISADIRSINKSNRSLIKVKSNADYNNLFLKSKYTNLKSNQNYPNEDLGNSIQKKIKIERDNKPYLRRDEYLQRLDELKKKKEEKKTFDDDEDEYSICNYIKPKEEEEEKKNEILFKNKKIDEEERKRKEKEEEEKKRKKEEEEKKKREEEKRKEQAQKYEIVEDDFQKKGEEIEVIEDDLEKEEEERKKREEEEKIKKKENEDERKRKEEVELEKQKKKVLDEIDKEKEQENQHKYKEEKAIITISPLEKAKTMIDTIFKKVGEEVNNEGFNIQFYKGKISDLIEKLNNKNYIENIPERQKKTFQIEHLEKKNLIKGYEPKILICYPKNKESESISALCQFNYENEFNKKKLIINHLSSINSENNSNDWIDQIENIINYIKINLSFNEISLVLTYLQKENGVQVIDKDIKNLFENKLNFKWANIQNLVNKKRTQTILFINNDSSPNLTNSFINIDTLSIVTFSNNFVSSVLKNEQYINIFSIYSLLAEKSYKNEIKLEKENENGILLDRMKINQILKDIINYNLNIESKDDIEDLIKENFNLDTLFYNNEKGDIVTMKIHPDLNSRITLKYNSYYYNRIESEIGILSEPNTNSKFYFIPTNNILISIMICQLTSKLKEKLDNNNFYENFYSFYKNLIKDSGKINTIYIPCFNYKGKFSSTGLNSVGKNVKIYDENNNTLYFNTIDELFKINMDVDSNVENNFSISPNNTNNEVIINNDFLLGICNVDILTNIHIPLIQLFIITQDHWISL